MNWYLSCLICTAVSPASLPSPSLILSRAFSARADLVFLQLLLNDKMIGLCMNVILHAVMCHTSCERSGDAVAFMCAANPQTERLLRCIVHAEMSPLQLKPTKNVLFAGLRWPNTLAWDAITAGTQIKRSVGCFFSVFRRRLSPELHHLSTNDGMSV